MPGRQFLGLLQHAGAALGRRRQDDLRAQAAHDLAALDRERLGHDGNEGIALGGADHGQGDAGVAGCGLDDCLAGLQGTASLRVVDDREGQAVLDGCHGIERLDLDVHVDVRRRQPVETNNRGIADGFQNIVVNHCRILV